MFLWEPDGDLHVTLQTEHMSQSGDAGTRWGANGFAPPVDRVSAVLAARYHDEGWRGYELTPDLDHERGLPVDFKDVDREKHAVFYGRGVDFLEPTHPGAALLISMHATGLYQGRYGVDDSIPRRDLASMSPRVREFITREEARQRRLAEELELSEADRWHDYRLVQIWDRLSIFAVWGQHREEFARMPLEDGTLGPALTATRLDRLTVRLDPFPYDGDEFHLPVRTFVVPRRRYASQREWDEVLAQTPASHLDFRLVR